MIIKKRATKDLKEKMSNVLSNVYILYNGAFFF